MTLRIYYYDAAQRLGAAPAPPSLEDAVRVAREGLVKHNARYAHIIDLAQGFNPVEMVHRDVLP